MSSTPADGAPAGSEPGSPSEAELRRRAARSDEPLEGAPGTTEVVEPPTLAPPPASPWSDGFGRAAVRSGQLLLVLGAATLAVYALIQLRLVIVPVLISILVAAAMTPVVDWLARRMPRLLATWITLLGSLAVLGGLGYVIVSTVRSQLPELSRTATEGLGELQQFITSGPLPVDPAQLQQAQDAVLELVQGEQFRSGAIAGATAAAEVVAGLFLGFVVLFFLLKDGARIWQFFLRPVSGNRRRRLEHVGDRSVVVLGGYVRGTAIVAFVDAVLIGIGLAVLGVPLALPLALVVFLGAFIPLIGAVLAGILAALVALVASGPIVALIVVGIVIAVNQIEGDVLAPIVFGKVLSLHPLAILLALTAGTILAGIIGALLAVPIAAVAWAAVTTWNEDKRVSTAALTRQSPPAPPQGPAAAQG